MSYLYIYYVSTPKRLHFYSVFVILPGRHAGYTIIAVCCLASESLPTITAVYCFLPIGCFARNDECFEYRGEKIA